MTGAAISGGPLGGMGRDASVVTGQVARPQQEDKVRIGGIVVAVWLIIGLIAAAQRGYFSSSSNNCAKAGSTIVTIVAGPLNYLGVNPKVNCTLPQPSR